MIHQDAPHRLRRHAEEMRPVLPLSISKIAAGGLSSDFWNNSTATCLAARLTMRLALLSPIC
jgi:hypothetical protein